MSEIISLARWQFTAERPPTAISCVDVWLLEFDEQSSAETVLLSADEISRSEKFTNLRLREFYLQQRAFRREVLARYLNCPAEQIVFKHQAAGKPVLADYDNLHFNLTHSGNVCLLAVADQYPLGIDIEPRRRVKNWRQIAQRVFPAKWINLIDSGQLNTDNFIQYWTRFEAMQKCLGEGVFGKSGQAKLRCRAFLPLPDMLAHVCLQSAEDFQLRFFRHKKTG